jgi:hypothetical protein
MSAWRKAFARVRFLSNEISRFEPLNPAATSVVGQASRLSGWGKLPKQLDRRDACLTARFMERSRRRDFAPLP